MYLVVRGFRHTPSAEMRHLHEGASVAVVLCEAALAVDVDVYRVVVACLLMLDRTLWNAPLRSVQLSPRTPDGGRGQAVVTSMWHVPSASSLSHPFTCTPFPLNRPASSFSTIPRWCHLCTQSTGLKYGWSSASQLSASQLSASQLSASVSRISPSLSTAGPSVVVV
jgi:hypothetical protein